ncbi:MAG: efflux transporter periplasmic adaptor subunit, partial [gamma proteobacterium symbiont of Ctena orbiculata]
MRRLLVPFILSLGLIPALTTAETGELDTVAVVKREAVREFWLDGVVEAINQTTISAQTRGQVEAILFDVDDYVEKGQVVVQLKDTEQQ